ncbi:hypothetical protein NQ318_010905 [Aromia moschata]|uniref:Uncharacterized protein n=1 Tax=Aromia moschata TaxID=1265417 RepID=A0AAV8XJX2_9CUCU|nr:hypothetical protein NQ318_010905 [Aromia moschata]
MDFQSTKNQGKSKMEYHEFQGCLGIKSEELNIKEEYDEYDRNGNNGRSSIYSHVIHSDNTEIKPFVDKSCNLETSHSTIKSDPS